MPTFDFTAPDGKSYSVDGPEGATPEQAFKILQQHIGAPAPVADGSSLGGVAKSLGTGLAEGVIGLAGLPGDLYNLAFGEKGKESDYGSASFKKQIEGMTGEFYKPKGVAEETASKIGQFAPAVIGGPGSMAAKVATRVVAPAVASEAAGLAAGDTAAKPYAELAGALGGAAGATAAARKFQNMAAARNAASKLPSGDELVASGSRQFDQAHAMDVVVKPNWVEDTAQEMRAALKGHNPNMASPVFQVADRLESLAAPVAKGMPPTAVQMNEVEYLRQELSKMRMSPDSIVRGAASEALKKLNQRQAALTAADAVSGDAQLYSQTIRNAVGDYGAGKRSQIITGKRDLGELNSGTAGTGGNDDNALRQALKQLARPISNTNVPVAKKLGFIGPEIDAIKLGATGTLLGNTARYVGKLAPTGSVSGVLGAGAGYGVGGPVGAVALPAVGYVAKKIGDLSTKRAVSAVDSLVRSRSPLAAQVAAQLPPHIVQLLPSKSQRLLQSLILADPALSKQASQPVGQPYAQ